MYTLKTKNQPLNTNYFMNPYVTDEEIEYIAKKI